MFFIILFVVIANVSLALFIVLSNEYNLLIVFENQSKSNVQLAIQNGNLDAYSNYSIVTDVVNVTTTWIEEYGYAGVFTAALLENLFPPIPSELIFPLAGITAFTKDLGVLEGVMGMSLAGAAGSTAGALIIYYVSRRIGRDRVLKLGKRVGVGEKELEKAEEWFEKHGQAAVFFGRMAPGIRELISIPAGFEKMKLSSFIIFTFAGSLVWCSFLTTIGFFLGDVWSSLYDEYSFIFDLTAILVVGGILAGIVYRYYKNKRQRLDNMG
jgi:membrane protein DedA with SNARE-associated domain